jgi:uncharacterized pyridoxamine 5'-phosphate oxidase family protein
MPTLTRVACFCSLKGKIDFENLLVLEKMLKNLPLQQNIFSFTYNLRYILETLSGS